MSGLLTHKDTVNQSKSVWNQFGEKKWIPYAKINANLPRKDANEFFNKGIGKTLVLAGMGESLEDKIGVLKKYRDRFEILTCDKGFGPLLDHGVKADYVFLCDSNIPYDYIRPWLDETKDVSLITTVYGNIEWTVPWKGDRYFFIHRDAIESEKHFYPIFGNSLRTIPASSNVSNAMFVFFVGCDEYSRVNWAGYDRYLMVGYDYSWRPGGNYYAWIDPKPKRYYMNHRTMLDVNNDVVFTSENLWFSCRWLFMYMKAFGQVVPAMNASGRGLLEIRQIDLEKALSEINPDTRSIGIVRQAYKTAKTAMEALEQSKRNFEMAREGLYQWQSATMQR